MRYEILIRDPASAEINMQYDLALLESLRFDPRCVIHFYEWETKSATYGYFIDPNLYFNPKGVEKHRLQLARRPTGGGIIFHTSDFTFSVLIPANHPGFSLNPLDSYMLINQAVLEALGKLELDLLPLEPVRRGKTADAFCMLKPTRYDLMWNGRKVGGAAERRMKQGLLHQGSIFLGLPEKAFLSDVLKEGELISQEMVEKSSSIGLTREQIRFSLLRSLRQCLGF